MIISCSQCWTCCLKQFDACPLTAHHLAVLRARKRQEKSTSLALSLTFLWIRVMRKMQICLLPGQLPSRELSLQNGQRARLSSRAAAVHLPCLGIVTCPSIGKRTKPSPYILALQPSPTWTVHSPVLIQRWIKPQGNAHNILPVVQKEL